MDRSELDGLEREAIRRAVFPESSGDNLRTGRHLRVETTPEGDVASFVRSAILSVADAVWCWPLARDVLVELMRSGGLHRDANGAWVLEGGDEVVPMNRLSPAAVALLDTIEKQVR